MAAGIMVWLPGTVQAETVDRVVASIGHEAITQRDVEEEYHFEQFLQGQSPTGTASTEVLKSVLSRLISQRLLVEQMSSGLRNPQASKESAEKTLMQLRKEFSSEDAYNSALELLGMTESQVLQRLELYQQTLRMIDERLRPLAQPTPEEVKTYYDETFVPEYAKEHSTTPPPLAEIRAQIHEIIVQRNINQLLARWLDRLKSRNRVTIHSD